MNDQCDHESLGCRFVSPDASLPSLEVIASSAAALHIFYNVISRRNLKNLKKQRRYLSAGYFFIELENALLKESGQMIECLKMPKSIEEILQRRSKTICLELFKCLHYFQCGLFCGSLDSIAGRMLNFDQHFCVWHSNGTVDYKNTTSNLLISLSTSRFDVVRKFVVMSNFCMEEELKTFDLNSLPKNFFNQVNFNENCLVYYWIRRLKNELHEIHLLNFNSIEVEMAFESMRIDESWALTGISFSLKPRHAFKYFWNRLDAEDRISITRFWLNSQRNYYDHCLDDMLSTMSCHQQHSLLSQMPDKVILKLGLNANSPHCVDAAMWAWTHSKDLMTIEQFQTVVVGILDKRRENKDAMRVLSEILKSASNQQQNYAVKKYLPNSKVRSDFEKWMANRKNGDGDGS